MTTNQYSLTAFRKLRTILTFNVKVIKHGNLKLGMPLDNLATAHDHS